MDVDDGMEPGEAVFLGLTMKFHPLHAINVYHFSNAFCVSSFGLYLRYLIYPYDHLNCRYNYYLYFSESN